MDTQSAETLTLCVRERLMADESRVADTDRADDDLTAACADGDESVDDSVIVVVLDGDEIVGDDDGDNNDDSSGGSWGDGSGYDDGAQMRAHMPQPELSDERRDRVIVMLVAALAAGTALLIGGIVLAGAAGWIQPACGGILVTRTATCQGASQPYTTLNRAVTPDLSRYRLDTPAAQGWPTPQR